MLPRKTPKSKLTKRGVMTEWEDDDGLKRKTLPVPVGNAQTLRELPGRTYEQRGNPALPRWASQRDSYFTQLKQ